MTWNLQVMPLEGDLFDQAIEVYGKAFVLPPYRDPDRGREVRNRLVTAHHLRPGYDSRIAVEKGSVVGMAYVHVSQTGQWWHDTVTAAIGRGRAEKWLSSALELVEIAVDPSQQSRGIGTALITELLADRSEETCMLSTRTDSNAHRLYGRVGFEIVHEMPFAPGGAPFFIMGKVLT